MAIDSSLYAIFSDAAYKNSDKISAYLATKLQKVGCTDSWKVLPVENSYVTNLSDSFSAVVYGLDSNNDGTYEQVVIAYRGSDSIQDFNKVDSEIACGQVPDEQLADAIAFYDAVKATYGTGKGGNISLTGHSLGGALAELVSADYGNYAVTFNAPGMESQAQTLGYTHTNILNYVIMNDVVGTLGEHIGTTLYYTPTTTSSGLKIFQPHMEYINTDFSKYFSYNNWTFADALSLAVFDYNDQLSPSWISSLISTLSTLPSSTFLTLGLASNVLENSKTLNDYLENTILPKAIEKLEKDFGEKSLLTVKLHYSTNDKDYILGTSSGETLTGSDYSPLNSSGNDLIWGNGGNDSIDGLGGNDTIYGGDGADTIHGGDGNDVLYAASNDGSVESSNSPNFVYGDKGNDIILGGGTSNDILDGGAGDDTIHAVGQNTSVLIGGDGNDTYYVDMSGNDAIIDTDGSGSVVVGGKTLTGGSKVADKDNTYTDGTYTYVLTNGTLKVSSAEGSFEIDVFANGDLGIVLKNEQDKPVPDPIATGKIIDNYIYGDCQKDSNGKYLIDEHGRLIPKDECITGTALNDQIDGRGGNDIKFSRNLKLCA